MKNEAGRKHEWMPCIANRDNYTDEEWIALQKRCYFIDFITDSEWRTILDPETKNATVHRSKLKKKAAGWLMALARISLLAPEILTNAVNMARKEYAEIYHPGNEYTGDADYDRMVYQVMSGKMPPEYDDE